MTVASRSSGAERQLASPLCKPITTAEQREPILNTTSKHTMRRLPSTLSLGRATGAILAAALTLGVGCVAAPTPTGEETIDTGASALTLQQLEQSFVDACSAAVRASHGAAFPGSCAVSGFARTVVDAAHAIVEYSVDVQVGPGAHDVIGLHRVVQESSPFQPATSGNALMLVHGDAWSFRGAFLDTAQGNTFAAYLAGNGIDVWGIDLRWTRVPAGTTDFSFMSSWGMAQDAQDLRTALSIARLNRSLTGSDLLPVKLLGWSRGGQLGYSYVGNETTLPAAQRHVSGFIPVDIYLKTDLSTPAGITQRDDACQRLADSRAQYADTTRADRYVTSIGSLISTLGQLALALPADPSPVPGLTGLTNTQAALLAGEATFSLQGGHPATPFYHFVGGSFDASGLPTGLTYVASNARWFSAMTQAAPFEPIQVLIDADATVCGDPASTLDAHLAQVSVPVLYVGAAGGFGSAGLYTTTLLGSADKSSLVVSLAGDQLHDIGHSDIFLSQNAQTQFWSGILGWLKSPSPHCQSDAQCGIYVDYEKCSCESTPAGTQPPKGYGECLVDPCRNKAPACRSFTCVTVDSSGTES